MASPLPKKVLVPIVAGTEPVEATVPIDVLRRAGADATVASAGDELVVEVMYGVRIVADALVSDVEDPEGASFDLIALPGGVPGAANLGGCAALEAMVRRHAATGGLYAAICAAPPLALASWGLLYGLKATAHPLFVDKFPPEVAAVDASVVVDGNAVTSRGPATSTEFALALVEQLYGKDKSEQIAKEMVKTLLDTASAGKSALTIGMIMFKTMYTNQEIHAPLSEPYPRVGRAGTWCPRSVDQMQAVLSSYGPSHPRCRYEAGYTINEVNSVQWKCNDTSKVLVPVANGTEEMELITIIDVLRRADADVVVASAEDDTAEIVARHEIVADTTLDEAAADQMSFDLIILPGGTLVAKTMSSNEKLVALLKKQAEASKPYGAVGAATAHVLEHHGLLEGKKAAVHPSMAAGLLKDAGECQARVLVDGNVITGRSAGTAMEFAVAVVEKLLDRDAAQRVAGGLLFA